jgi:hypothetical protein
MRQSFRWLSVLALAILLAGCGTSTTRLSGTAATPTLLPTATPRPTATPSPTPKAVPQATLGADGHPCYASSVFPAARGANVGDFIAFAGLGNLAYPGSQLPEGLPLKPYKVPSIGAGASNSLPVNPGIGKGASGYNLFLCNASTNASHTINSVTSRIASLIPYTGQLNEHPACDGPYARPGISGGGCGGGDPIDMTLSAGFPAGAAQGSTATATQDGTPNPFKPWRFEPAVVTPLPITLAPGDGLVIKVTVDVPAASGTYAFDFGFSVDGAAPVFISTSPVLLAPVAHTWTGKACLTPAMQAQIPPDVTNPPTYYLCPNA